MARSKVYVNQHLSHAFEDAILRCRVIMFSAPARSGKTSVAKALLRRQRRPFVRLVAHDPHLGTKLFHAMPDVPTNISFASFRWSDYPCVMVDDLDRLEESDNVETLRLAMARNPLVQFVLCGSCPLPEWLLDHQTVHMARTFGPDDLCIDESILPDVAVDRGLGLSAEDCAHIFEKTQGYPSVTFSALSHLAELGGASDSLEVALSLAVAEFHHSLDMIRGNGLTGQENYFLLSLSPFSHFDFDFAEAVTNDPDVRPFLRKLISTSSLVCPCPSGGYMFWPIFNDYLHVCVRRDFSPELQRAICHRAALYYDRANDYVQAARWYSFCGEDEKVVAILARHSISGDSFASYRVLAPYYDTLDEERVLGSVSLMAGLCTLEALRCNYLAADRWYGTLKSFANDESTPAEECVLAQHLLCALDIMLPNHPLSDMLSASLEKSRNIAGREGDISPAITSGLPSALDDGRDLSAFIRNGVPSLGALKSAASALMGFSGVSIAECGLLEVRFMMGEDVSRLALEVAAAVSEVHMVGGTDIEFAMVSLLARIEVEQGNLSKAKSLVVTLKERFLREGQTSFVPSIEALQSWLDLFDGDVASCRRWGNRVDGFERGGLWIDDRYEQICLAELRIAQGRPGEAVAILDRWLPIFEACNNMRDLAMACTVRAIAFDRMGVSWEEDFTKAMDLAAELGYVRLVSEFGPSAFSLIERSSWNGDAEFFEKVKRAARRMATLYPCHLLPEEALAVPVVPHLTNTELRVLRLLCEDLSNAQIMEEMGIRLPTVKTHVLHIMKKLDARSRGQAKTVAQELGIV